MFTLFPAYVVKLLIEEDSVLEILLNLTCYCLILYSTTILYKRLERSLDNNVDTRRMFKCLDYYDNIMATNYQNIDINRHIELQTEFVKVFNEFINMDILQY